MPENRKKSSAKAKWTVLAVPPGEHPKWDPAPGPRLSWDFPEGFFPRNTFYKKDAERYASEARSKGGRHVEIVRGEK